MILRCLCCPRRGRASRYRASLFHCQTSLPCAYPCSSVAFLGIDHPCLCISARLISLPGHASPSRFRAFPCNPYPSHCVAFLYVSVAAPRFDLHRFPIANPCIASRFHAHASLNSAMHCHCFSPQGHASLCHCSARTRYTLCLCFALPNIALPLRGYALLN